MRISKNHVLFSVFRAKSIILSKPKFNWFNKLINQQEGILANKVINGTYLLNDFLNRGDVRHQIQLKNIGDLRIPLYAATQSQLFVRYRAIKKWNGLSCDLRSSPSLCTFKNKLRQLYLSLLYIVSTFTYLVWLLNYCPVALK